MVKKTKEEKLKASARRDFYRYEAATQSPQKTAVIVFNQSLIQDLKKTAILTGIIIAFQIILFLALRNKVIVLPGITY